jgi:subtilisin family serine protease
VTIAVVDTGLDAAHEDLAGRIVPGRDLVDGDDDPQADHWHATHVAGIAAATLGNGRGIAGVAPAASIMSVRVLRKDGDGASGSDQTVAAGIRWAADHGADVINLSLGDPDVVIRQISAGGVLVDAIADAWERGAIAVLAAGNEDLYPSGYRDLNGIVVAATTHDDALAAYSSPVGVAKWGMAAPGGSGSSNKDQNVLSSYWQPDRHDLYAWAAGTSMAVPHVAGAAALLRSLGLTPQQTVDRLLATAVDLGLPGRDLDYGSGRLAAAAAVAGYGSAPGGQQAVSPQEPAGAPPAAPGDPIPRSVARATGTSGETSSTPVPAEASPPPRDGERPGLSGSPIAADRGDAPAARRSSPSLPLVALALIVSVVAGALLIWNRRRA